MGRRLDILLGRTSSQTAKLKTLLGLTVSRLAILRNNRLSRCSNARGDVAQILLLGQQERALIRAEQVIHEQNMLDAFVIIENYCYLLTERAALLDHLKECPEDLKEAISGVIFAASRCGDMPELHKVRRILASKLGNEFASAAVELRNHCGVSPKLIQKMSTRQPSLEIKIKITKEIAAEKGIALDLEEPLTEVEKELLSQSKKQSETVMNIPVDLSPNANQQFKDAASAAQAAFESAAFAAAAARVAVELSRLESQGKGGGDGQDNISDSEEEEEEEEDHQEDLHSYESRGKPMEKLERSPSGSSSGSADFAPFYEKFAFPASSVVSAHDEGVSINHKPAYLRPPYSKGNPVSYGGDSDDRRGRVQGLSTGQGPVSMRTRKGF